MTESEARNQVKESLIRLAVATGVLFFMQSLLLGVVLGDFPLWMRLPCAIFSALLWFRLGFRAAHFKFIIEATVVRRDY